MKRRKLTISRTDVPSSGSDNVVSHPDRVRVFVRIRPLTKNDVKGRFSKGAVAVGDTKMTQVKVEDATKEKVYTFDRVLQPYSTNHEVFDTVGKPLIEAVLTGVNGILMAYGQTGAGKTYTLMGSDGLTASVVNKCFAVMEKDNSNSYSVSFSYLQIYQEKMFDLLCKDKGPDLFMREHPKKGVYVENLMEFPVQRPDDIVSLLKTGKKRLICAETQMNRQSSRSHAICILKIERVGVGVTGQSSNGSWESDDLGHLGLSSLSSRAQSQESLDSGTSQTGSFNADEDQDILGKIASLTSGMATIRGKLYICDLAGSERIKKTKAHGERLQEAQSINSSLLELGNVIHALAEGKRKHIPFRNSTLTRLLQDGLSGNSKTSLIVCVSPSFKDVNETICSLKFGLRAMKVQNTAQVNVEVDYEKMARSLAETLGTKEREWRKMKASYESYIGTLKSEKDKKPTERSGYQSDTMAHNVFSLKGTKRGGSLLNSSSEDLPFVNHTKAVLLAELASMELFYGIEDLVRDPATAGKGAPFSLKRLGAMADRDLLLQSAETLLELTGYFFGQGAKSSAEHGIFSSEDEAERSENKEDESAGKTKASQVKCSLYQRKLLRVRGFLQRLKTTTDSSTVKLLSQLLKEETGESKEGKEVEAQQAKRKLHSCLKGFLAEQEKIKGSKRESSVEPWALEQSLCHVLMDKALTNCLLLLDKAEMEKELKRLLETHPTPESKGPGQPLTVICPKHCSHGLDGFHLKGDGRLVSIDEGVVLDSPSGSISPGALTSSQTSLCSTSGKSPTTVTGGDGSTIESEIAWLRKENSDLRAKLEEKEKENDYFERKLEESERLIISSEEIKLSETEVLSKKLLEAQNQAEMYRKNTASLEEKLKEMEHRFIAIKKSEKKLRAEICDDMEKKLVISEDKNKILRKKVSSLERALTDSSLSSLDIPHMHDRDKLSQELSNAASQNARLSITALDLQELLRESEERVAALEENEFVLREEIFAEANLKLDEVQAENSILNERIKELEDRLTESGKLVVDSKKFIEKMSQEHQMQMKELKIRIRDLEEQLDHSQKTSTSAHDYEEKLRNAEDNSRQLSDKIMKVEQKLRSVLSLDGRRKSLTDCAIDEMQLLREKLEKTESEKCELELQIASVETKLQETDKIFASMRDYEVSLEEDMSKLKLRNGKNRAKQEGQEHLDKERQPNTEVEDPVYDLRIKNIVMAEELRNFREHSYSMESQLFMKDQEILCLKNEIVDLMSEVSKIDAEFNELVTEKADLENRMVDNVNVQIRLEREMNAVQTEKNRALAERNALSRENTSLRGMLNNAGVAIEKSVEKVLEERTNFEKRITLSDNREKSLERIASKHEEANVKLQLQMEMKEITIAKLQTKINELMSEKQKLDSFVENMSRKNMEVIEENKSLVEDIKLFEVKLNSVQDELTKCSREKEKLLSEVSLRFAENESVRAFASLCTEETEILKSQLTIQQVTGEQLEKEIKELQQNVTVMQRKVNKLTSEKTSLEEEKELLQRRVQNASQVIDRVKEELLGLMKTVLNLQRELIRLVDKIMSSLEIDEVLPSLPPKMPGLLSRSRPRLFSNDSGYLSCNNQDNVSDITSSTSSETLSAETLTSSNLLPDEDCLVNPSDISIIRENKFEIFRMHEELRAKLLAIRDAVTRLSPKSADSLPDLSGHQYSSDSELFNKLVNSSDRLKSKILPFSSRAERMKLNGILSLFKENELDKGGLVCNDDHDIFNIYVKLEEKLSGLSNELSKKETEISKLLQEKERLQSEMIRCGRCGFASEKLRAEEAKESLSEELMACVDETSHLETELLTLVQYKSKLEQDLESVKKEIGGMEDELGTSPKRNKPQSQSGLEESEDDGQSNKTKEKHVTFGTVEHSTILLPSGCKDSLSSDLSGSDVDLVALLASLPLEKPIDPRILKERQEMEEMAHRLSSYDNLPFNDKVDIIVQRKKEAEEAARPPSPPPRRRASTEDSNNTEPMNCKMCAFSGLFRTMRRKNKLVADGDVYTKHT